MDPQAIREFLSTAAIAFWIIGRWLIGRVIALISAAMNRNHVDPTLTK